MIDHLVYAAPDLEQGISLIEQKVGLRPAAGGKHVGRGTRNALLAFGNGAYLEIIAPDPEQEGVTMPLPFGLNADGPPRLVTWAAKAPEIERMAEAARAADYDIGRVMQMSRELPDGARLSWSLTFPPFAQGDGLVPFLIRWDPCPHPSETSPGGSELVLLQGEHPEPERVRGPLLALGLEMPVSEGPEPALVASIRCPKGLVDLR
jgi:hypothetical protein